MVALRTGVGPALDAYRALVIQNTWCLIPADTNAIEELRSYRMDYAPTSSIGLGANFDAYLTLCAMKIDNFAFTKDLIGIELDGKYIDLHNNFDFVSFLRESDAISLNWRRLREDWVPESTPAWIRMKFESTSYVDFRGTPSEDLMEFGFFENESLGKVEYNGIPMPRPGFEVFLVRFENGAEIAIRALSAKVCACAGA